MAQGSKAPTGTLGGDPTGAGRHASSSVVRACLDGTAPCALRRRALLALLAAPAIATSPARAAACNSPAPSAVAAAAAAGYPGETGGPSAAG